MVGQVCGVIDALANFQQSIIDAINGKFAALRRLAELLERLGDLSAFIPDISQLVPISSIDISIYENLRSSCPFLNLPPASGDPGQVLGNLRSQVDAAYGRLLSNLDVNPLSRMSKLQQRFDDYQAKFNLGALKGTDFMSCLQAACQAAVQVEGVVSNLSNTSPTKVLNSAKTYLNNMVNQQGQILNDGAKQKVSEWQSTRSAVQELRDVPAIDLPNLSTNSTT